MGKGRLSLLTLSTFPQASQTLRLDISWAITAEGDVIFEQ